MCCPYPQDRHRTPETAIHQTILEAKDAPPISPFPTHFCQPQPALVIKYCLVGKRKTFQCPASRRQNGTTLEKISGIYILKCIMFIVQLNINGQHSLAYNIFAYFSNRYILAIVNIYIWYWYPFLDTHCEQPLRLNHAPFQCQTLKCIRISVGIRRLTWKLYKTKFLHKLCWGGCFQKKKTWEGGRFCWLAKLSALAVQGFNGKSRWRSPAEEKHKAATCDGVDRWERSEKASWKSG